MTPLVPTTGRPAAVFDLDGTLIQGTSAERLFVPWLVRRGVIGVHQIMAALAHAMTLPVRGPTAAFRGNKRWLTGLSPSDVAALAEELADAVIPDRLSRPVLDRWEAMRGEGRPLLLLSGAPAFLAEPIGRRLGADDVLGTDLVVRDGCFTGAIQGEHFYGERKRSGVRTLVDRWGISLDDSIAFGDADADVAFLACFGCAVAVDPGRRLRREALRRGWEVLESTGPAKPAFA